MVADLQGNDEANEVQGHWFQNVQINGKTVNVKAPPPQQWNSFSFPNLLNLAGVTDPGSTDNLSFHYEPPTS